MAGANRDDSADEASCKASSGGFSADMVTVFSVSGVASVSYDASDDGEWAGTAREEEAKRGAGRTSHWCDSSVVNGDMEPSDTHPSFFFTFCAFVGAFSLMAHQIGRAHV